MKRSFVIFCTLMIGALSFSSCNKKLKDDINELKNQIGVDEAITATTTFTDKNGTARTITGTYKIKDSDSESNALVKNSDGTYSVYIDRSSAVHGDEGVSLEFTYDPASKKITYKESGHYWTDFGLSNGEAYVYEYDEPKEGLTFNLNIKTLDLEAGLLNVEVKIEATKEYSNNNGNAPNNNAGFTTTYSFSGKLKKFERNNQPS